MLISYVYVVGVQDNPVKVGHTNDLKSRLVSLQIGCPDELRLLDHVEVVARDSETVERLAHQSLSEHHRRGEWFNVDAATARAHILRAKRAVQRFSDDQASEIEKTAERLLAKGHTSKIMDPALLFYRQTRLCSGRQPAALVRKMDRAICTQAGKVALNLFRAVIVERRQLADIAQNREQRDRADVLLGNAITVLYRWHRDNYVRGLILAS